MPSDSQDPLKGRRREPTPITVLRLHKHVMAQAYTSSIDMIAINSNIQNKIKLACVRNITARIISTINEALRHKMKQGHVTWLLRTAL